MTLVPSPEYVSVQTYIPLFVDNADTLPFTSGNKVDVPDICLGVVWVQISSIPKISPTGELNYSFAAYIISYFVVVNWTLLQVAALRVLFPCIGHMATSVITALSTQVLPYFSLM